MSSRDGARADHLVPSHCVCMFSPDWSISSLPNCIDPNPIYPNPLDDPDMVPDAIFNERPSTKLRTNKGKSIVPDLYQMVLSEMKLNFRKWKTILSENVISLLGNKDHPNACLCLHDLSPCQLKNIQPRLLDGQENG
ncbi:hypothetical protein Tco_1204059 [Tanacetum coccineum]